MREAEGGRFISVRSRCVLTRGLGGVSLLHAIQGQPKWLWPLLLVLQAVQLGSWLSELHYLHIERPRLLSPTVGSFTPCESFTS
jgi:hypothetical protein